MINNVTINLKEKTVVIVNNLSKMKYKFIKYDHHNHKPTAIYIIYGVTENGQNIKITLPKNITNLFIIE